MICLPITERGVLEGFLALVVVGCAGVLYWVLGGKP